MTRRKNRKIAVKKNCNVRKNLTANRKYKDTVFRMLFSDRRNLLSLYNAVNGSAYEDEAALEIVTLENAIYMGMKNDLAFIVDTGLFLYEHQSTYTPNMPLRDLFYISAEYQKFVNHRSLYSSVIQKIPATPTMTPIPSISPTPTPVSEIQKNILTVPQKEEELTEEECRQKMQLIYCRKEIRNAAEAEIIPDRSRVIAVVSIRINGKEADWHWRSSRILLKLNPQEMQTEIETAIMCRKELSWTEAKKNAILTYNIF